MSCQFPAAGVFLVPSLRPPFLQLRSRRWACRLAWGASLRFTVAVGRGKEPQRREGAKRASRAGQSVSAGGPCDRADEPAPPKQPLRLRRLEGRAEIPQGMRCRLAQRGHSSSSHLRAFAVQLAGPLLRLAWGASLGFTPVAGHRPSADSLHSGAGSRKRRSTLPVIRATLLA
jgi:hypothetical protein